MDLNEEREAASIWELDGKWRLYINLVDFDSPRAVVSILAHEYGHMLTLNNRQTRPSVGDYGIEMSARILTRC